MIFTNIMGVILFAILAGFASIGFMEVMSWPSQTDTKQVMTIVLKYSGEFSSPDILMFELKDPGQRSLVGQILNQLEYEHQHPVDRYTYRAETIRRLEQALDTTVIVSTIDFEIRGGS